MFGADMIRFLTIMFRNINGLNKLGYCCAYMRIPPRGLLLGNALFEAMIYRGGKDGKYIKRII
jgi:hypothetical protein